MCGSYFRVLVVPPTPEQEARQAVDRLLTAAGWHAGDAWLQTMRDDIGGEPQYEPDDFEYAPFSQQGGLGKVHQLFGDKLNTIIEELNETLAA